MGLVGRSSALPDHVEVIYERVVERPVDKATAELLLGHSDALVAAAAGIGALEIVRLVMRLDADVVGVGGDREHPRRRIR